MALRPKGVSVILEIAARGIVKQDSDIIYETYTLIGVRT